MNMKEFVKWVLAVLCGLFVWGIVKALMFIMMIGSMASSSAAMASSGSTTVLPKEGVMLVDMSRTLLAEQSAGDDPMRFLQSGEMYDQVGILDAVNAIRKAAEDPAVKMILLKTDNASNVTYLEEFRKALTDFRKSGKAVVAYGEAFTSWSYYLASVADKIYSTSHHGGNVMMLGVSGRMMFLKDLLDRLGINYQLIRHGKYKSAGEMYIKNSASPENMEQNQEMVASIWETIGRETAESRGISKDSLDLFIDRLMLNLP
jgi:protease-4